jgi:diketogulonate reductase-like aldo/keto reductase
LYFLSDLQEKDNKIRALGLTNFDTEHTKELLDMGAKILTNQVIKQ